MTIHVNIGEAKTRLSELVAASLRGEEVVLARAGKPVARIVGLQAAVEELAAAERAARKAAWEAWVGSKAGLLPPEACDLFLEPTYTDEEMEAFEDSPDNPLNW